MEIEIAKWIGGVISAIAVLFGIYFAGKKTGKSQVQTKVAQEKAKEAVEKAELVTSIAKDAHNVETSVAAKSDTAVTDELRDKWTRD